MSKYARMPGKELVYEMVEAVRICFEMRQTRVLVIRSFHEQNFEIFKIAW